MELSRTLTKRVKKTLLPAVKAVLGTVTHVETDARVAALTFDDGPHPIYTPKVLKILEKHGAKATFFMVGEAAQRLEWIVAEVALAGHAIGNHSWNHLSFVSIPSRERRRQLRESRRVLEPYGERLFRPPRGDQNYGSRLDAFWYGYKVVTWSVPVGDWFRPDPEDMASRLMEGLRPGSIFLLHDNVYPTGEGEVMLDREPMLEALDLFLTQVGTDMQFVTLPELFRMGRPVKSNWHMS